MDAQVDKQTDVIEQLVALQDMDRRRDRLQKRLDEVPVKLKKHTDVITALEAELEGQETSLRVARAEADRAELDVKAREAAREKIKVQMNAPKLSNREYEVLQEELAGVLADINSLTNQAVKSLDRAAELESESAETRTRLEAARAVYEEERERLEGALAGVKAELEERTVERTEFARGIDPEPLLAYERVRAKHPNALAVVDGTIDRAAGRIGNDLHCSACYMTITSNDAVHVLGRKKLIHCKSCVRILYVP